jgi:APA family basic amino acid/polyamine antiporter
MLGAGAFGPIPPAVADAGWWSLAGLALAAVVAGLTAVSLADLTAQSGIQGTFRHVRTRLGVLPGRFAGVLDLAGRVVGAAAVAGVVSAQFGSWGPAVAVGLVVIAAAAHAAGIDSIDWRWRIPATVAIVTVLGAVLVGLAIAPESSPISTDSGVAGSDDPTGILAAAGLLFLGFGAVRHRQANWRTPVLMVLGAAVAVAAVVVVALRQLGGPRLALSPTPLGDILTAADGASLVPLFVIGLAVAAQLALYELVGGAVETVGELMDAGELPAMAARFRPVVVGVLVSALALLLAPVAALGLAATLLLGSYALLNSAARTLCRSERSMWLRTGCCGLALSVIVGVNISIPALLSAVGVLVVGTLLCTVSARSAEVR